MDLSLATRNNEQIYKKSKQERVRQSSFVLSSFLAEYDSKSNLRSVAVRRVGFIRSCLSF